MSESRTVVLLCADLMMTSTVSSAAAQSGLKFRTVAAANQLRDAANEDLVMIDLATPGLDIQQAAAALNDHQKQASILYGPHVHTDRFEQARGAGFEHLMARGQFNAEAVQIVRQFAEAGGAA